MDSWQPRMDGRRMRQEFRLWGTAEGRNNKYIDIASEM